MLSLVSKVLSRQSLFLPDAEYLPRAVGDSFAGVRR